MRLSPIHPFPARMAPEIILESLASLPRGSLILDPMSGSGTVLRASVEAGLDAIGVDADPLAVLMSRVWTRPLADGFVEEAEATAAAALSFGDVVPDWHLDCAETAKFAEFWFEAGQSKVLAAISRLLRNRNDCHADALRLALSRVIVTKEKGASIARDTSHSRPHRVFFNNDFDVARGFVAAARRIADRIKPESIKGSARVHLGDSRSLILKDGSVDAVITSPPYLNAIDYMRGHRLALIWLGYTLPQLRTIRSLSIGTEAGIALDEIGVEKQIPQLSGLSSRHRGMVRRYSADIDAMMKEIKRVVRPGGRILLVVGNSTIKNVHVPNADINLISAQRVGLKLKSKIERDLPTANRYLPIPNGSPMLSKRMRTETILMFDA